jgi:molybdopterin synthase catalytic subunit
MSEPGRNDKIALSAQTLDIAEEISGSDGDSGAVSVFLGTTRHDTSPQGRPLVALEYEAYETMALEQMRSLAEEARRQWPINRLTLLHRTGLVKLGEASVLVAVWSPHRAEAFAACRFLIDQIKAQATIWKKEVWADGSTSWVNAESN